MCYLIRVTPPDDSKPAPPFSRPLPLLLAGLATGLSIRFLYVATSLGTLDALLWYRWVELIEKVGIFQAYLYSDLLNHPPFALLIARATSRVGALFSLEFNDSFRLLQSAAEVVSAFVLVALARRCDLEERYVALIYFLSPVSIWISGFHCNSDPLMLMFLLLSLSLMLKGRPGMSGLTFAAACGIKIVPIFAIPFMFAALRDARQRRIFMTAFIAGGLAIFGPGLIFTGPVFIKNIFGYTGMPTAWGLTYLLGRLAAALNEPRLLLLSRGLTPLLVTVWLTLAAFSWRRWRRLTDFQPRELLAAIGTMFLIVIFIAPGFGVQYLLWPLPFLPFILRKPLAVGLHLIFSIVLFVCYTVWSDGWPWTFADGSEKGTVPAETLVGFMAWLAIGAALAWIARGVRASRELSSLP
jgi:hypothetical protein